MIQIIKKSPRIRVMAPRPFAVDQVAEQLHIDKRYAAGICNLRSDVDGPIVLEKGVRLKGLPSECKAEGEANEVVGTITTEAVDRDREVLIASGADLRNYRKNPVVLWMHRKDILPIGRNLWIRKAPDGRSLVAKTKLKDKGIGREIMDHLADGFPLAISVGLMARVVEPVTPADVRKRPAWADADRIIREWELTEYSLVTVPANQEALIESVKKGLIEEQIAKFYGSGLTEPKPDRRIVRIISGPKPA